jgi:Uma2 family endonuclease
MVVSSARRLFTVDEYYRMAAAGVLTPDDRVELIEGEVVKMNAIGPLHAHIVDIAATSFTVMARGEYLVRTQHPVRLDNRSEPEPDLALVKLKPGGYRRGHPIPEDVFLIMEVADSSLLIDQTVKLRLYAEAGIPEYWLLDLTRGELVVNRAPRDGSYTDTFVVGRGERIAPAAFPDREIALDDLLD